MRTIALLAATSHTSARCSASIRGAGVTDKRKPSAVAAYAMDILNHATGTKVGMRGKRIPSSSISALALGHQRERRLEENVEIEKHRPVLDVIQVEFDALLDLLFVIYLATPAVDLCPAGDAGLDAVTREISVHGFVEQPALQFALHRVRARTDQREIALEHDVEKLRQFVEAGPADEAPDAGDAAVVLGHDLRGQRVGLIVVQRAKLEDVDALVVESETLLAEQHRARTVELDRNRDQRHQRRGQKQDDAADQMVEQPLHHQVPVGDRRLEHVEGRNLAEIGIGAGTEA